MEFAGTSLEVKSVRWIEAGWSFGLEDATGETAGRYLREVGFR